MAAPDLFRPGFLEYYRQGHFSDVTILTQTRTYKAHRMVLAFSSEFFEAMLLGEFQETQTSVIDLRDTFDPRDIFPEVLRMMYSGRVDITQSTAVPLLAMSDVLLISAIQNKCNEYIATHMNKKTALNFLLQATELHQERLAQQCIKVLACNFLHICDDTNFSGLDLEHFVKLICHPRLAVKNEWTLFTVIMRYLESYQKKSKSNSKSKDESLELNSEHQRRKEIESSERSESSSDLFGSVSSAAEKIISNNDTLTSINSGFSDEESELILALLKNVRFFFFTYDQLLQASQAPLVPKQLLVAPLLARLQQFESPKSPIPVDTQYAMRLSCGIQFEVSMPPLAPIATSSSLSSISPPVSSGSTTPSSASTQNPLTLSTSSSSTSSTAFSGNSLSSSATIPLTKDKPIAVNPIPPVLPQPEIPQGIMHWLGTNEGTSAWSNPATVGIVAVHASSMERGHPHSLVDLKPQELWTHDVPASWLSVDLGRFRVLPHAYMLRHGGNYKADSLRNWDFQGSIDGKVWTVLKRHSHDSSLSSPFATNIFFLDKPATVPYQWFRIIQTGHNSSNHNFLVLSGLELFGELWDKDALLQFEQ